MKKYKLIKEYPGSVKLGCTNEYIISDCSKYPEFWEEIIEKDYEVLSYLNENNLSIYIKENKNNYFLSKEFMQEHTVEYCERFYKIHSIKRLSDGEVFTVGDKVINDRFIDKICIIDYIFVTNDDIKVNYKNLDGCWVYNQPLDKLVKAKQPIFQTEDGVDIFEDDYYYQIHYPEDWEITKSIAEKRINYINLIKSKVLYSTKEKAEEYILMNKPCLSYKEASDIMLHRDISAHYKKIIREKLKELVKQKLNK